jgi:hypothetical protein
MIYLFWAISNPLGYRAGSAIGGPGRLRTSRAIERARFPASFTENESSAVAGREWTRCRRVNEAPPVKTIATVETAQIGANGEMPKNAREPFSLNRIQSGSKG